MRRWDLSYRLSVFFAPAAERRPDAERWIRAAQESFAHGRLEQSSAYCRKALASGAEDPRLLNRAGDLLMRARRCDEATDLFLRVGRHYAEEGFNEHAIAIYRKILRHDPWVVEAQDQLAALLLKTGLPVDAHELQATSCGLAAHTQEREPHRAQAGRSMSFAPTARLRRIQARSTSS